MKFLTPGIVASLLGCCMWSTPGLADIRIAVAGPMEGQFAAFGEQMLAGAAQAVADINAAGGVAGKSSSWKLSTTAVTRTRRLRLPIS